MFFFLCAHTQTAIHSLVYIGNGGGGGVVDGDNNNTSSRSLEIILLQHRKKHAFIQFVFVHKHNVTAYFNLLLRNVCWWCCCSCCCCRWVLVVWDAGAMALHWKLKIHLCMLHTTNKLNIAYTTKILVLCFAYSTHKSYAECVLWCVLYERYKRGSNKTIYLPYKFHTCTHTRRLAK